MKNSYENIKPTKFWLLLFAVLLVLSAAAAVIISHSSADAAIANVYLGGQLIHSIDLTKVTEAYEIDVSDAVCNTIRVDNGRICVKSATCPDQVCVHQGYISNGIVPIVCMPNKLVIRIERANDNFADAVSG